MVGNEDISGSVDYRDFVGAIDSEACFLASRGGCKELHLYRLITRSPVEFRRYVLGNPEGAFRIITLCGRDDRNIYLSALSKLLLGVRDDLVKEAREVIEPSRAYHMEDNDLS